MEFFEGYEFQRFTYDPSQPPEAEFTRLCDARNWGTQRRELIRMMFDDVVNSSRQSTTRTAGSGTAAGSSARVGGSSSINALRVSSSAATDPNSPIRKFFLENSVPGYTYRGRSPHNEWRQLLKAKRWKPRECKREGTEENDLYINYLQVVEEEVDYLIERNLGVRNEELKPWQYLCQMFKVGEAPVESLSKNKAKKVP